jgi:hypothetical protein
MPSAADGVSRRTEDPEDKTYDDEDHAKRPQERNLQQKSDDE